MSKTTTGWVVFLASIGMMFGLLSVDIVALKDFGEVYTPLFVGTFMGHVAAVIAAFVGGKLIPLERDDQLRTRASDVPHSEPDEIMDPITAVANLVAEITKLVAVIVEGQPPEVRKEFWQEYLADVKAWRKLFHLDP